MTDEDRTAAKLKGYTCILKFRDGEELLLAVDLGDEDAEAIWFEEIEDFIHSKDKSYFPITGIAVARDSIKYIRKI